MDADRRPGLEAVRELSALRVNDLAAQEPAREDRNHGDPDMCREEVGRAIEDHVQTPIAAEPGEQALNGLITNDKFCLTRQGTLQLSWPRARRYRTLAPAYPHGEVTHRGGEHGTPTHLVRPAHRRANRGRPAALGSGLPAPPPVGDDEPTRVGAAADACQPAGGAPCV
jgi:hypothetical protein